MSLHPGLIIGLAPAVLFYAVAALIYLRKGMRTKRRWYGLIASALFVLAFCGFGGILLGGQWGFATVAVIGGTISVVSAMQWRPPATQGNEH